MFTTRCSLQALRCPGGPRMTSHGVKHLLKASDSNQLRRLNQRFILNLKLTHQVMDNLRDDLEGFNNSEGGPLVVEIGSGPGALTRSLLTRATAGVLGVEIDPRFNSYLDQIRSSTAGRFQWVNADILASDEMKLIQEHFPEYQRVIERRHTEPKSSTRTSLLKRRRQLHQPGTPTAEGTDRDDKGGPVGDVRSPFVVVSNLPFEHATNLLHRYAFDSYHRRGIFSHGKTPVYTFLQQGVAERLIAQPPSASNTARDQTDFGRPSVLFQNFFSIKVLRYFSEMTYFPRTEVLGALVQLRPRDTPLAAVGPEALTAFLNVAFRSRQRQQTCANVLEPLLPPGMISVVLQHMRLDGSIPIGQLSVREVATLAAYWERFFRSTNQ